MRDGVCREHDLLVLDVCPSGGARSEGPLLVEEPRCTTRARLELRFRRKVQGGSRADRLGTGARTTTGLLVRLDYVARVIVNTDHGAM